MPARVFPCPETTNSGPVKWICRAGTFDLCLFQGCSDLQTAGHISFVLVLCLISSKHRWAPEGRDQAAHVTAGVGYIVLPPLCPEPEGW
jgi:hypothetical protein